MNESFYITQALEAWRAELAADGQAGRADYEFPVGLYGWGLHAQVLKRENSTPENTLNWVFGEYDFEFVWNFDEKEEPNKGEFTIYNLSDATIRRIFIGDSLVVHGGFGTDAGGFIHTGITEVETRWKGPEKVTTLYLTESGANVNSVAAKTWYDMDAGGADIQAFAPGGPQISRTYGAGIRAFQIMHDLAVRTGIPALEVSAEQDRVFTEPVIVEGPLFTRLAEYAAICGSTVYTANGLLVIKNLAVNRAASRMLISQQAGLLDAPTPWTQESQSDGKPSYRGYTVRMLGTPRLQMGAPVLLQSRYVNAELTVLRGKHSLNGKDFITEATLIE